MNRRGFLLGAAAAILVPERKIFLPPVGGWPVDYAELGRRYAKALADSMVETQEAVVQRYIYRTYALGFAITDRELQDEQLFRWVNEQQNHFTRELLEGNFDGH